MCERGNKLKTINTRRRKNIIAELINGCPRISHVNRHIRAEGIVCARSKAHVLNLMNGCSCTYQCCAFYLHSFKAHIDIVACNSATLSLLQHIVHTSPSSAQSSSSMSDCRAGISLWKFQGGCR